MSRSSWLVALAVVSLSACGGGATNTCARTQCGAECVDTMTDPRNCGGCGMACPGGNVCVGGACALSCPMGTAACGGTCVNLDSDPRNCGACGTACSGGLVCATGKCSVSCPKTQTNCSGACVNLDTDAANCGTCGNACPQGNACTAGKCAVSCAPGQTLCGGACVNLKADVANCGACGMACPPGNVCSAGVCGVSCPMGQTNCGGACANLDADPANCGACGGACPQGQVCAQGKCVVSCPQGQTNCGGSCVTLATDPTSCGACGKVCSPGQSCVTGTCMQVCPMGFVACNTCVNLMVDNNNCGACNKVCGPGTVCSGGACVATCAAPMIQCNNRTVCVDPRFDTANCGSCGNACPAPANAVAACVNSACVLGPCTATFFNCDGNDNNGCEVNGTNNVAHCGGCNKACAPANGVGSCTNGVCGVASCNANFGDCDGKAASGCESNLNTDAANCGKCGTVCAGAANADGVCVAGKCATACKAGFGDCDGNAGNGCETNLTNTVAHCGACNSNCGAGVCVNGLCTQTIHNTINFIPANAAASTCAYNGCGAVKFTDLGLMTWKQCIVEASKRSAMLAASNYTNPSGWYSHRNGANAMTGVWSTYRQQSINTPFSCVVGRDPNAVFNPALTLASVTTYDGQVWHYQDFGMKFYDECQALATQYGSTIITPYTIGLAADNYWVQSVHACNTYEWITNNGAGFGNDNVGVNARSTSHLCMVGYVDN